MLFTTITTMLFTLMVTALAAPQDPRPSYGQCQECVSSPNNCDITAPCSSIVVDPYSGRHKLFCGCRPGYRAGGFGPGDTSRQWRLNIPGHEHRVWVTPGVSCDYLCRDPFGTNVCGEVSFNDQCKA
ncbi:MAG: hypothetical protein M1816_003407 [Peltula sp. TS41687]|nr:MAG: hypothetical protein M1816_003407 [Peltula sp. TS41687]